MQGREKSTYIRALAGVGFVAGLALLGGLARASSPSGKARIQPLLAISGQVHPKHGVIYRGDLQLVLSPDQREITRLRYTESTRNLLSMKKEQFSIDLDPARAAEGATLMEFTSRPVITLKADRLRPATGGTLSLLITRDQRKGDTRVLHLKLARNCATCPVELSLDESGESGTLDRMGRDSSPGDPSSWQPAPADSAP